MSTTDSQEFDCDRLVLKEEENQDYPEYIERSLTY